MVVVAEVMGLEHAPDFERWHDAEVTVDADVVHAHAVLEQMAPTVVAMVLIDLSDTVKQAENKHIVLLINYIFNIENSQQKSEAHLMALWFGQPKI